MFIVDGYGLIRFSVGLLMVDCLCVYNYCAVALCEGLA